MSRGFEVVTAAYLSQDAVLMDEVIAGTDFHANNQARFRLPTRTTAKIFMFKLIYGATAWGYANDSDFIDVSRSEDFWQGIIDEFYNKYRGVKQWHEDLVSNACRTGTFKSPSGREYSYPAREISSKLWYWRPKILNYPVQGLGADLVMLARISAFRRVKALGFDDSVKFITTVHDSLGLDMEEGMCYNIGKILKASVEDVPTNFKRMFGKEFNLPLSVELKRGNDLKNMEVFEC